MTSSRRTDTGQRLIAYSPDRLYAAHVDPEAIAVWRPPAGMTARIEAFDAREGGGYRMAFVYEDAATAGKSGDNVDLFEGRFVELVPGRRIVEQVVFDRPDPRFRRDDDHHHHLRAGRGRDNGHRRLRRCAAGDLAG